MLKILKEKSRKLIADDRGSAIVLVIIALAMVGILAVTIMWMSMTNYYMKATDKGNKQGFYAAETVLEQIKAGVEEDASEAASRAYAYILTKDYSAASTNDRNYDFKQRYMTYFVDIVCGSDRNKYSVDHLRKYVDASIQPELEKQTSGKINWLSTSSGNNEGNLLYDPSYDLIKIEGLHLEFTDSDGRGNDFLSIIDTDIMVNIPDVSFTQMATVPDVFEYALVADTGLDLEVGGKTTLKGSMYVGDDGIKMHDWMKISDANMIISKGDVVVGSSKTEDGPSSSDTKLTITGKTGAKNTEFWVDDIRLGNGVSFETSKVDTYVADDMTLSGRKATVKMTGHGSYYGYGCSDTTASESSAIVINGLGSTVDMDELDKVVLMGRTFVSVPHLYPYTDPVTLTTTVSKDSIDFAMGESLAIKGEQIAFLVPDACISYKQPDGTTIKVGNPFTTGGLTQDQIKNNLKINLADYSAYVKPDGWSVIFPNGDGGLAYVYMTMEGSKANEYYEAYYKKNNSRLDNYFLVYSGSGKVEVPGGAGTMAEGNFITALHGYSSSNSDNITESTNSQLNKATPISGKEELSDQYKLEKNNLCTKLMKEGVDATEVGKPLFENLIKKTELEALFSNNGNTVIFDTPEGYKSVFVKAASGTPYEYTENKIRVLIVDGDVHVTTNFIGLLIASGTVTVDSGVEIRSILEAADNETDKNKEMQALKDAIQVKKSIHMGAGMPDEEHQALQYFVDGSEYDIDGLQSHSSTVSANKVDFTELVKFNNWVKR